MSTSCSVGMAEGLLQDRLKHGVDLMEFEPDLIAGFDELDPHRCLPSVDSITVLEPGRDCINRWMDPRVDCTSEDRW